MKFKTKMLIMASAMCLLVVIAASSISLVWANVNNGGNAFAFHRHHHGGNSAEQSVQARYTLNGGDSWEIIKSVSGGESLVFDGREENQTGRLRDTNIELDRDHTFVVFEFTLKNLSGEDFDVGFIYTDTNNDDENIRMAIISTNEQKHSIAREDFGDESIEKGVFTEITSVEAYDTQYCYLMVAIASRGENARCSGSYTWTLDSLVPQSK